MLQSLITYCRQKAVDIIRRENQLENRLLPLPLPHPKHHQNLIVTCVENSLDIEGNRRRIAEMVSPCSICAEVHKEQSRQKQPQKPCLGLGSSDGCNQASHLAMDLGEVASHSNAIPKSMLICCKPLYYRPMLVS